MQMKHRRVKWMILLAVACAGSFVVSVALGQFSQELASRGKPSSAEPNATAPSVRSSRNLSIRQSMLASMQSRSARLTYGALGGIDNLKVQATASGALLRFSYRVLDANKAKAVNDKRTTPYLIDLKTGAVLQIPQMPKVGILRNTTDPVDGAEYWMAFSNKGVVKPGSRVNIVIGNLHFNGLVVQ
jgi:hypothetical protein